MSENPWTPEAETMLRDLAAAGHSASEIARALNKATKPFYITFTRNAVIGKSRRLGLKLNGDGTAAQRSANAKKAARSRWGDPANHQINSEAVRLALARTKGAP